MRGFVGMLLAATAVAGCDGGGEPAIHDPWVRLPAVAGRPGAAYFLLRSGARPITIVAVRSPAAVRAELHESMAGHAGMTSMKPLDAVTVPAGAHVAFSPAGRHVMLFDIDPGIRPGAFIPLTLALADGTTLDTRAQVFDAAHPPPQSVPQ